MKKIILVVIILFLTGCSTFTIAERTEIYPLRAINISSKLEASGTMFLLVGSIKGGEEVKYNFYLELPDGGVILKQVDKRKVILYEDGKNIVEYYLQAPENIINGFKSKKELVMNSYRCNKEEYRIHIPRESIVYSSDVDIKNIK